MECFCWEHPNTLTHTLYAVRLLNVLSVRSLFADGNQCIAGCWCHGLRTSLWFFVMSCRQLQLSNQNLQIVFLPRDSTPTHPECLRRPLLQIALRLHGWGQEPLTGSMWHWAGLYPPLGPHCHGSICLVKRQLLKKCSTGLRNLSWFKIQAKDNCLGSMISSLYKFFRS